MPSAILQDGSCENASRANDSTHIIAECCLIVRRDLQMKIVTDEAARACSPWDRAPHTGVRLRLHSVWPVRCGREMPDGSGGARVMTWAQKNRAHRSAIRDLRQPGRPASI